MEVSLAEDPVICVDAGPYLDALTFDEAVAVELRCIEGWEYREIAHHLAVSMELARKLVERGLRRIRGSRGKNISQNCHR